MPKDTYKSIRVNKVRMSYIEQGQGDPILFIHGNPTWSYLWRHVMPQLSHQARCIAVDLVGMGHSGKPPISYRFEDHYAYLKGFIEELGLKRITLVLHDWGSALGFHYAFEYPGNIKGIAFMEALVRPWQWRDLKPSHRLGFHLLRGPVTGELMIYVFNAFLNEIMPRLIIRKLNPAEKNRYKEPFRLWRHRKPMLVWPREIPINKRPVRTYRILSQYSEWLKQASFPKLLLYATPGAIIDEQLVKWCRRHFNNLETAYVGHGRHFIQEDHPRKIGQHLEQWYRGKILSTAGPRQPRKNR